MSSADIQISEMSIKAWMEAKGSVFVYGSLRFLQRIAYRDKQEFFSLSEQADPWKMLEAKMTCGELLYLFADPEASFALWLSLAALCELFIMF